MAGADAAARALRQGGATDVSFTSEKSISAIEAELNSTHSDGPLIRSGAEYSDDPRASKELRSSDLMANLPGAMNREGLRLGATVKGMVLGDWTGAKDEQRAMNEGTLSAGGYLVPTPLSAEIIDIARAQSIVMRLGAVTQPMESSTLSIARVTQDVVPEFAAENAVTSNSDLVLDRILLVAHTAAVNCRFSIEMLEDTDVDGVVSGIFGKAIGAFVDKAMIRGDGTGANPTGVRSQAGITVTDLGTNGKVLTDWSDIVNAITTLRGLNENATGVALAPRTAGSYQNLQDTLHQPLEQPTDVAALPFLTSTAIPVNLTKGTSSLASEIYVADWSQCIFATRTQLTIEASRFAADTVSSAMSQRQCWLRGYLRFDVAIKHPKAFVVLNGSL